MKPDMFHIDDFPVGCMSTDKSGQIRFANKYFSEKLGFKLHELKQKNVDILFTHASRLLLESYVFPAILKYGRSDETLLTILNPQKKRIPVVINACPHPTDNTLINWSFLKAQKRHQLHTALTRARDVFEGRANALRKLAATDELTGLYNRREFLSRAAGSFRNAMLTGASVSVFIADVDHFKRINDTYGHAVGDEVLRNLGQQLKSACRSDELVARYGGEEFVFCVEGMSPTATAKFAERMHAAAAQVASPGDPLTISIGVGLRFGGMDKTLLETLGEADQALYAAKEAGRNQTFVADNGAYFEISQIL